MCHHRHLHVHRAERPTERSGCFHRDSSGAHGFEIDLGVFPDWSHLRRQYECVLVSGQASRRDIQVDFAWEP